MTDNKLSKQEIHSGRGMTENVDQLLHDPDTATAKGHLRDVNSDLTGSTEHDEGDGQLLTESGDPVCHVHYVLDVFSGITGTSARFDPVKVQREYRTTITTKDNKQVRDGRYHLSTSKEILTVVRKAGKWQVQTAE